MLSAWLDFHRATLALKCQGLDDRQLRLASAAPSEMTLLGLVQHLAEVERNWFQRIFAGLDVPPVYEEGKGDGFTLVPGRGLDEALDSWRAQIARSRELVAAAGSSAALGGSAATGAAGLAWPFAECEARCSGATIGVLTGATEAGATTGDATTAGTTTAPAGCWETVDGAVATGWPPSSALNPANEVSAVRRKATWLSAIAR